MPNTADAIRFLTIDAIEKSASGHPGMPMGMADVATVLFEKFLKFNPKDPQWPDRDRFILSAGHGSMLQYALLYLTGYDLSLEDLKNFRQWGSKTPGHPEFGHTVGVETTTGPLGQGLGNAVGMALAEAILRETYGEETVNHHTYVIVGDGCLMEGLSQEAISLAGHLNLHKLIVLFDDNDITIDGPTSIATSEDHQKRFEACGWRVEAIDGHDPKAIEGALNRAQSATQPTMIACKTQIAKGSPHKAGTSAVHGSPLGTEETAATRQHLSWPYAPFEVPNLPEWRSFWERNQEVYLQWTKRYAGSSLENRLTSSLPHNWKETLETHIQTLKKDQPKIATRLLSQGVLDVLTDAIPSLLGGSADLTGSNNTKGKGMQSLARGNLKGNYVHYGIREHAMAAAMNGLALHGGFIPYGGTFLAFSDYCRPSIRLAALMGIRSIFVMTHDSIGLGEDGPTHQPIEHLAALRAIPNLNVFRPADAVEVAECWALALASEKTPSLLTLTRQNVGFFRTEEGLENKCAKGAYILREWGTEDPIVLMATGSEVSVAIEVHESLKEKGFSSKVVSMPCWRLFDQQPESYRTKTLSGKKRIAIEAACSMGWHKYTGENGLIFALDHFGASAPYKELYKAFGLTKDAIINALGVA